MNHNLENEFLALLEVEGPHVVEEGSSSLTSDQNERMSPFGLAVGLKCYLDNPHSRALDRALDRVRVAET